MWKLSDESVEAIRQLYELERPRFWFGRAKREEGICDLLNALAEKGEPEILPVVARLVTDPSSRVRRSARHLVTSLLATLSPYDLIQLDDLSSWSYPADAWDKVKPSDVADVAGEAHGSSHSSVLGVLSFHRNGFVRQEAVRHLTEVQDGSELPFLLIRQNDWVVQIAEDAQTAVKNRINDTYLPHLVRSLRLVLHLNTFSRYDHSSIVDGTIDILLDEKFRDALRSVVESSEREVRRRVVGYGLEKSGEHRIRLVSVGLESDDPIVRLSCCRAVPLIYNNNRLAAVLARLKEDRFMPVRREALQIEAGQFPTTARETWQQALLDLSRSIRELARFHLTKIGYTDFAAFYRRAIADSREARSAIEGLAESGDSSDIGFFQRLLEHPLPSRRCAAIRGLSRVQREAAVADALPLLNDDSPSVVREVRHAVGPHLHLLAGENILAVALDAGSLFARKNAVALLADFGKWQSLPWLLRAATKAEKETSAFAEQMIERLSDNRVFTKPTEQQAQDIEAALSEAKGRVSPKVIVLVEDELVRFG